MKRLFLALLQGFPALAARTTVTDTLQKADGSFCTGSMTISWVTFYNASTVLIQGGSLQVPVNTSGIFTVNLEPTNLTSTPPQGFYTVQYSLRPNTCAPASETWSVPISGSPVNLLAVRTVVTPPPPLIPVTSLNPAGAASGSCLLYTTFIQWALCQGVAITGTPNQITASTAGGTATIGLAKDIIFPGQSANGTDMLSAARFTDTTPTGNFFNYKSAAGTSLWKTDVTGTLQAGIIPFPRISQTGANIVSLFSGCSGTQYLGADGACHAAAGTVTSFSAGNLSPLFTTSVATSTSTPALTFTQVSQTQNLFFASPNGSSGSPTFRAILGADLPNPSSSTLGGTRSITAVSHQFLTSISTAGIPAQAQPAFSDVSGSATCSQLPALTGDATSSAGSCATTVVDVNGAVVPASATALASNSSRQIIAATVQGNGAKVQLSTGTTATNDCVKFDANGNTVGAGVPSCAGGAASITQGAVASVPGTCTTNDLYWGTDGPYKARCSATNTWTWFLEAFSSGYTPLATGNFTSVNLASSTTTNVGGTINMIDTTAEEGLHGYCAAEPSTPTIITIPITYIFKPVASDFPTVWLGFSDGTKFENMEFVNDATTGVQVLAEQWSTSTTVGSSLGAAYDPHGQNSVKALRIKDDGTNKTWWYSIDGLTFVQFFSEARATFLTPSKYCFGIRTNNHANTLVSGTFYGVLLQ